jgi:hypothetical protein
MHGGEGLDLKKRSEKQMPIGGASSLFLCRLAILIFSLSLLEGQI